MLLVALLELLDLLLEVLNLTLFYLQFCLELADLVHRNLLLLVFLLLLFSDFVDFSLLVFDYEHIVFDFEFQLVLLVV